MMRPPGVMLILRPHREGSPPARLGRYQALLGERIVVTSRTPFYSAARVLLREGVDPDTVLEARHEGSAIVAMRSTVGEAARWTVAETDRDGLRRQLWRPHPMASPAPPAGDENGRAAVGTGDPASEAATCPSHDLAGEAA